MAFVWLIICNICTKIKIKILEYVFQYSEPDRREL